jgi:glucans biosynthesis protein
MNKRWAYSMLLCLLVCRRGAAEFAFENVRNLARDLMAQPFMTASNELIQPLLKLNYEEYRAIQFNHNKALWHGQGLPFELEFFLPGDGHKQVVALHEIDGNEVRDIVFDAKFFNLGTNGLVLPANLGYAGFRILQPVAGFVEVAVFLDASYFRMIGLGQNYGTSGRGLALNTVGDETEEFPVFQQFWIRRPRQNEHEITVYALMDSRSIVGAFRFIIRPGMATVAVVKAALFPRREVKEFGVAPLTSMFLSGKNGHPPFSDFRPEVHDADGLLIQNGRGEWIWRPLEAGKMTRVNSYRDEHPKGFGLMQRERDFERYQDLVAGYQRRPSVWVRPVGDWGEGSIELVQLASDQEFFDNIVAFWRPTAPPPVGQALDVAYELHWTTNSPATMELGYVRATRIGRTAGKPSHLRFVIEFGGAEVESVPNKENLAANIEYGAGAEPVTHDLFKNEFNQTWRLVIEIVEPRQALDLGACLKKSGRPITEKWNYTWQP